MLLVKALIALAIPDVPQWVAEEMAKIEFERREVHKSVTGGGQSSFDLEQEPEQRYNSNNTNGNSR